jgi:2-dehydro-3-deoxy-D-arabinonate dehydratase
MRYYQRRQDGEGRLLATTDGTAYDLTSAKPGLNSFRALAAAADVTDRTLDRVAEPLLDTAETVPLGQVADDPAVPLVAEEVWAAGVTYRISEEARTAESGMPEIYVDVYDADRPELFLKSTPGRTVGPGAAIGVRGDSEWNVPEPELGVVLYRGEIVGYTIGNDVSSRSIEGANPLYLPQAKIYDRCCALGPCVATDIDDPHDLEMSLTVYRDEAAVFEGRTTTAEMVRTCEELVSYLTRHNAVPEVTVLLTGTSIVPDDEFSLQPGDTVVVDIEGIGTLRNPVTDV